VIRAGDRYELALFQGHCPNQRGIPAQDPAGDQ
jgi:hypothetical protein